MLVRDTSFVVVDVETTGISAFQNRITEIAMLRVQNGKITDRFETLIDPGQYIPPFIAQYTGITNTMVFGKPSFADAASQISSFIAATGSPTIIVGHNVQFDHGFISASYARARTEMPYGMLKDLGAINPLLCTCRLARMLLPNLKRRSLKHVADHYGIKIKARHRAMGDAEATANILISFIEMAEEEMEIETLDELLKLQYRRASGRAVVPRGQKKLRDLVRDFPERPGVYMMFDRAGDVLYVGKAKNLRDRVSTYFTASHQDSAKKLARLMKAVKEIKIEETGSELSALLLESRKIKELKPRFNSLEKRYKGYTFLKLDVQHNFPRLSATREPASDGADYYGPFRSRESVEALIDVLNRSFKLRECGDEFRVAADFKPCFYHEIKRCNAPCAMLESKEEYRIEVERIRQFLSSSEDGILQLVEQMMFEAAERLDFEEAQFLKLRLFELRRIIGGGERSVASLNTNDFVIMTKTDEESAEVFFVRFGRLVKQMNVNKTHLERAQDWFAKQLRMYYNDSASAIPPTCGKPEVDEMRILSAWCDRKKRQGSTVIYLTKEWDPVVPKLARSLSALLEEKGTLAKKAVNRATDVQDARTETPPIELNPLPLAVTSQPRSEAPKEIPKKKIGRIVLRPMTTD
ncbi:MAG TPA: DEDD exonuclease domain-containing protein [Candidatus Kapabacteria bacterium]|nr:DEDD exonuclease domain-containing protein [Candidatus Kapabacteria bacterium]